MRFLVDNSVSPVLAAGLSRVGHDSIHVRDLDLQVADDETIFERALREDRILVSADTDFGTILSSRQATKPSVLLFRHGAPHSPNRQLECILANLEEIQGPLEQGCLVTIEAARIRLRSLPIVRLS